MEFVFEKLISGGQTGVDRAALDAALDASVPCGGWCPRGRRAEDGKLHARYPLEETPLIDYAQRTEWNVRDTDATLIVAFGPLEGGTAFTLQMARKHGKPCLVVDLKSHISESTLLEMIQVWMSKERIRVLNVAGPRGSRHPAIYRKTKALLDALLAALAEENVKSAG